jgi:hypothetical protein
VGRGDRRLGRGRPAAILAAIGAALATLLTRPQDFIAHGSAAG